MSIRDPWLRALTILGCAIAGFYLFGLPGGSQEFADIILLFFLAWLVAFVSSRSSRRWSRRRLPRLAAIGLTYLTLLILVAAGVFFAGSGAHAADSSRSSAACRVMSSRRRRS